MLFRSVEAFLAGRIAFPGIWRTVAQVLDQIPHTHHPALPEILAADSEARRLAGSLVD